MRKTFLAVSFLLMAIKIPAQVYDSIQAYQAYNQAQMYAFGQHSDDDRVNETIYANFTKDSTYYIIGDKANIRLKPDTAGKIMSQLPIGEKIKIMEVTEVAYTKNGYASSWYKIMFNNKGEKLEGYIWGGMIASTTIKSTTDKNLFFMYGISKVVKTQHLDEVYIQVKVCKNNVQLAKTEIQAAGKLSTYNSAESIGSKGLSGVTDILKINFSDGYNTGNFGDAYFFWDGNTLFHIKTLEEGFDPPYYSTNVFIFPTDENGKEGYIINKSESGYYDVDDDKNNIEDWEIITYKWDGSKLMAIKTEKKK